MLLSIAAIGCDERSSHGSVMAQLDGGLPEAEATLPVDPDAKPDPDGGALAAVGSCNVTSSSARIGWKCEGPVLGAGAGSYDGWASVERSTPEELVLYVSSARLAGSAEHDAGLDLEPDADPTGARCTLKREAAPLLALPPNARVWLHETHDLDFRGPARLRRGSEITLRERAQGAVLLVGSAMPSDASDVLRFAGGLPTCEERDPCRADGRRIAYEVELDADQDVRVAEGQSVEIQLQGHAYTFGLHEARRRTGAQAAMCADLVRDERLWIKASLQALDAQSVIEGR